MFERLKYRAMIVAMYPFLLPFTVAALIYDLRSEIWTEVSYSYRNFGRAFRKGAKLNGAEGL